MRFSRRKKFLIGFVMMVLLGLLALAGGVATLDVTTRTVYLMPPGEQRAETPSPQPDTGSNQYLAILGLAIAVLLPLSILYMLISPEARKRFIQQMLQVALIVAIIYLFFTRAWRNIAETLFGRDEMGQLTRGEDVELKLLEPFAPQNPAWLSGLISFCVAVIILLVAYRLVRLLQEWLVDRRSPAQELESSARHALGRIQSGQDLRNVILRCYHEMARAVSERRQVNRPESATPREFTRSLESAGLPAEQVGRLTRLFEAARYSAHPLGKPDEAEAMACLQAIIACLNRDLLAGGAMDETALGGKA